MNTIKKCLKEGNPIVEALGNGIQSIIFKTFKPSPVGKQFLLFPTALYNNSGIEDTFKIDYQDFAKDTHELITIDNKTSIKYYATVEYVIEDSKIPLKYLNDFHILKESQLKKTINKKSLNIWLLRVYELKESYLVPKVKGGMYGNLKDKIPLNALTPVISDEDFIKIKEKLITIEYNEFNNRNNYIDNKLDEILENQELILDQLTNDKLLKEKLYTNKVLKNIKNKTMVKNKRR